MKKFMPYSLHPTSIFTAARLRGIVCLLMLVSTISCGLFTPKEPPPPRNKTETILFKCDKYINDGMLMPVELIYIVEGKDPAEVVAIGPDNWFYSEDRKKWPFKQAHMLRSGQDLLVELEKPSHTVAVVIFFNLFGIDGQDAQQVILTTDAAKNEVIWISRISVYH